MKHCLSFLLLSAALVSQANAHGERPDAHRVPPLGWALPVGADLVATALDGERLDLFMTWDAARPIDETTVEELSRAALEAAYEAGEKVHGAMPWVAHEGRWVPMAMLVPPPPAVPKKAFEPTLSGARDSVVTAAGARRTGTLRGKVVYLSAGHGFTWTSTIGRWATQRGNTHDIVEDLVSAETVNQLLTTYLENAGATVFTVRERDLNPDMVIVDAGVGGASSQSGTAPDISKGEYLEIQGNWSDSSEGGFLNGLAPYVGNVNPFAQGASRAAATSTTATAAAVWEFGVPATGDFRVYATWAAASNRAPDARYVVSHAGGDSTFRVDQRRHGKTWMSLGRFHFKAGERYRVTLHNDSATPGTYVSADAIRVGGGMGDAARGTDAAAPRSRVSTRPRWEENARYHVQFSGAPASVYAYTSNERDDDVGARSRYAAWQNETGEDSVYVAWHTNAPSPGVGTSTFVYGPNAPDGTYNFTGTAGSDRLGRLLHDEVVNDIKRGVDPNWRDRGLYSAYFGELNPNHNPEMPSALCEVAFHSTESDATRLKDPRVRNVAARAFYQAITKFFAERDGIAAVLLPEPPTAFRIEADGPSATLSWVPPETDELGLGGHAATGYWLYRSADGRAFDDGVDLGPAQTAGGRVQHRVTGLTPGEAVFFRVAAYNDGGESMPSVVLGVSPPCAGRPDALVVHGFSRLDAGLGMREDLTTWDLGTVVRLLLSRMNRFDATAAHGLALSALQIPFDSAESVLDVALDRYRLVDVVLGEESTADETFNAAEQTRISAWLDMGVRTILASGAELAWDLGWRGDEADKAFLARLGAAYEADDANSYTLTSALADATLGPLILDDGTLGTYDVEFPDVLTPVESEVVLRYGDGRVAGVRRRSGQSTALTFGVPLESLFPDSRRDAFFDALLADVEVSRLPPSCDEVEPGPEVVEVGPEPEPEVGPESAEAEVVEGTWALDPSRQTYTHIHESTGCTGGGMGGASIVILVLIWAWRRGGFASR